MWPILMRRYGRYKHVVHQIIRDIVRNCEREYNMAHTNIKLYGTNWCSDCKRSKKFLGEQRVHYEFIDIEEDVEGQAFLQKVQNGGMTIPTIVFDDGSLLIEPTNAELAAKLGLETRAKSEF